MSAQAYKYRRFYPLYPFGDEIMADCKRFMSIREIAAKVIFGRVVGFVCAEHDPIQDGRKPPIQDIEILWKLSRDSKKSIFYAPRLDHRMFLVRYDDIRAEDARFERTKHQDPFIHQVQYALSAQFAAVGFAGSGRPVLQNIYAYRRVEPKTQVDIDRLIVMENPVKSHSMELGFNTNPFGLCVEMPDAFKKRLKRVC